MLAEHEQAAASAPPPPKGFARLNKDIRTWVTAHKVAAVVATAAAILVCWIVYYKLVSVPARQRENAELEARAVAQLKVETAALQASLDTCLSSTKAGTDARWNRECKARGRRARCPLPEDLADRIEREESQSRNACLMQFSISGQ
jgi:hypothetical protein